MAVGDMKISVSCQCTNKVLSSRAVPDGEWSDKVLPTQSLCQFFAHCDQFASYLADTVNHNGSHIYSKE